MLTGLLNLQMDIDRWVAGTTIPAGSDLENQAQVIDTALPMWQPITVGRIPFDHADAALVIAAEGFVLLTDEVTDINGDPFRVIVGFGRAEGVQISAGQVSFHRTFPQPIAAWNASATPGKPPVGWQNLNLDSLFDRIQTRASAGYLLQAPALRRTMR